MHVVGYDHASSSDFAVIFTCHEKRIFNIHYEFDMITHVFGTQFFKVNSVKSESNLSVMKWSNQVSKMKSFMFSIRFLLTRHTECLVDFGV